MALGTIRRCLCCGIDDHLCHGLATYLRNIALTEGWGELVQGHWRAGWCYCGGHRLDEGISKHVATPEPIKSAAYVGMGDGDPDQW